MYQTLAHLLHAAKKAATQFLDNHALNAQNVGVQTCLLLRRKEDLTCRLGLLLLRHLEDAAVN